MLSTGSKLFLGLTAAAVAGFVVYGFLQEWGALGVIGLASAAVALAFLGGVVIYTKDADVSSMDAAGIATAAAGQPAPRSSLWPLIGAVGGGLLVIGLVTDRRWFVAGIAAILVAIVEWMVQGWAASASADAAYNADVRGRLLQPLEFPFLAVIGLGALIFSFSRIMLRVETDLGPVVFVAAAAVITFFGFVFAAKRRPGRKVIAALCTIGAVGIVAPGIWAAAEGEREELAHEAEHFEEERHACGEEVNAADEDASGSVSAKSSIAAEVVLRGNTLTATEFGRPAAKLFLQRGNPANILFKNENDEGDDHPRRLVARYLVAGSAGLAEEVVCTNAIDDGKVQLLTLIIPKPSAAAPEGREFKLEVPGIEGAEIEIEVP